MGFERSVYQNLIKKDGFWTKCVLEIGKKNDGFRMKCVLEFGKKKVGF